MCIRDSDYRSLDFDFTLLQGYQEIRLIAWYMGCLLYTSEQERGYDFNEDVYGPGYFEVDIKKGESIVFSGGVSEASTRTLKRTFEEEVDERTPRDNFQHLSLIHI